MEYALSKLFEQAIQFCGDGTQRIALIMSNGFGQLVAPKLWKEVDSLFANRHA
jgi:hypothetical protein